MKKKLALKKYHLFLSILICITCTSALNAQTGISLQSRHILNPEDEIRLRDYIFENDFLSNQGFVFELSRSRDKKLYAVAAGFNYRKGSSYSSAVPELFAQVKFKLFKPLFEKPKVVSHFSIGPRLLFTNGELFVTSTREFPNKMWLVGLEVPVIFNLDFNLSDRLFITTTFNVLSPFLSVDKEKIDNPNIAPALRENSGFNLDFYLFNEFRLGLGYLLSSR